MLVMPTNKVMFKFDHPYALFQNICQHNSNAGQIAKVMLQALKSTCKTIRFSGVCHMLKELKRKRVGTNEVEYGVNRACSVLSANAKNKVKMQIMSGKIGDAYRNLRKQEIENSRTWRQCRKVIPGVYIVGYLHIWKNCTREYLLAVKRKNGAKVDWLIKKWRPVDNVPTEVRGIDISDQTIPNEFSGEPRVYGGVKLDDNEKKVLGLPPKFGVFQELDATRCRIDLEESLNKLRWNKIKSAQDKKKNVEHESQAGDGVSVIDNDDQAEREPRGFVDAELRDVDIGRLKVTDLPYNPSVCMPGALGEDEIIIHQFKNDVMEAVDQLKEQSGMWSNLDESEKKGLKQLCHKVKKNEMVLFTTDKSGRWACDSMENYKLACMNELSDIEKTPTITNKDHSNAETQMNSQALALLRMMGLDPKEPGDRLRRAVVAEGVTVPPFYGMRKDHKAVPSDEEEKGPKIRPVCGAKDCVTKRTSYILCLLLGQIISENATNCLSTNELLTEFERLNRDVNVQKEWVVGSLDVDALYPSLDIKRCAEVVSQQLFKSDLVLNGLKWKEIALYLKFHLKEECIKEKGISQYCPKRKHRVGKPPLFTASGSKREEVDRFGPWIFPDIAPDAYMTRKLFCWAIEIMVVKTMEMHDFQFDGDIYRQSSGGSIGLDLTGVISDIYMSEWDRQLIQKMTDDSMQVRLYKRYKDDVNFVAEMSSVQGAVRVLDDASVMKRVKLLAESIDENLKISTDCCSNHSDGRLPILDVKVWIGSDESGQTRIMHTHYMKEVSNRMVINEKSSHSDGQKFHVMVNELDRILKNCSVFLKWEEEAAKHGSYFMRRLQYSGYGEQFRYDVAKKALERYDKRLEVYHAGGSMFDSVITNKELSRGRKGHNWYKESRQYDSVMFVEAMPGSLLKRKVEEIVVKHRLKIKVVERVGRTVKSILQKSNPFPKKDCGSEKCQVCLRGCEFDCRLRGCVYEIQCNEDHCGRKYRGTTGRNIGKRIEEHVKSWDNHDEKCPLQKHSVLYHGKRKFEFNVDVVSRCYGKPSRRMISEAVHIDQLTDEETMNSRQEWSYLTLNKVYGAG